MGRKRLTNQRPIFVNGCTQWPGALNSKGYPQLNGVRIHRAVYLFVHGYIPPGMSVCHHCDNPCCIDATHLWLGTPAENTADMVAKGRSTARPCAKCGGTNRDPRTRNCIPCQKAYHLIWQQKRRHQRGVRPRDVALAESRHKSTEMLALYRQGLSKTEIGSVYGITRTAVARRIKIAEAGEAT